MGDGPRGTLVGVHGVSVAPQRRAGAWALALVASRAAVAPPALAGAPAAPVAALSVAAALAVVAAAALVAGVALGLRVAMGLGVGVGKALCLGVHGGWGRPCLEGQGPPPPPLLADPASQRPWQPLVI